MKVITQNCHGIPFSKRKKRLEVIAQQLKELSPDVIFLQELIFKADLEVFRLEGYLHHYESRNRMMCGGLVTLVKNPAFRSKFHRFKEQGQIFSRQVSDRLLGKGFLVTEYGNTTFINTHLISSYGTEDVRDTCRLLQLDQLLSAIDPRRTLVLAGDFNFSPHTNGPYAQLKNFRDQTEGMGPTYQNLTFDYIFTRANSKPGEQRMLLHTPSDHKGIYIELEL